MNVFKTLIVFAAAGALGFELGAEIGDPVNVALNTAIEHNRAVIAAVEAGAHRYSTYRDVNLYPECAGPRMPMTERDAQLR